MALHEVPSALLTSSQGSALTSPNLQLNKTNAQIESILQQQQQQQADSTSVTVPAAATIKPPIGMDANQAARSMYPSIARSLQKYLRLTKQTGRHNLQSIYEHLSKCLLYKLGSRAFLEKFVNLDPVWQQNETKLFAQCRLMNQDSMALGNGYQKQLKQANSEPEINSWSLICDTLLSRQINSGKLHSSLRLLPTHRPAT